MRRDVRVVCREGPGLGFALAGFAADECPAIAEGARRVAELLHDEGIGVLLVETPIHDALPEGTRRAIGRRPLPMVVPFPAPERESGAAGAEALIVEILRQAIGYRVRLR